jgi:hypothetical protein
MAIHFGIPRHDVVDEPQKYILRFITTAVRSPFHRLKFEFLLNHYSNTKDIDRNLRLAMAIVLGIHCNDLVDKPQKSAIPFFVTAVELLIRRLKARILTESLRQWQRQRYNRAA